MQTSWPEPSRPPPPRPAINADAQPKTSRNLPRPAAPQQTKTPTQKRAAISRARRRTLKGARLRHVECGAFDGARPRGRRIADHWIATSTSIGMGNQDLSPEAATVALA